METIKVTPGLEFPSTYADSNPLWRVVKARGNDTWDCVVTDASADYSGTRKVFGGEEIRRAVASAAMWRDMATDHDSWWNARKIGETVHYDNGFQQYIRGNIVWEVSDEFPNGRNVMVPTGLVGKGWRQYDLPRYDQAGNLSDPYHVRQIRDGKPMQPNYSNMVEARGVRKGDDPRGMPAIDLTPPAPTAEQIEAARLFAIRTQVLACLNAELDTDRPYSETLRNGLAAARQLLDAAKLLA